METKVKSHLICMISFQVDAPEDDETGQYICVPMMVTAENIRNYIIMTRIMQHIYVRRGEYVSIVLANLSKDKNLEVHHSKVTLDADPDSCMQSAQSAKSKLSACKNLEQIFAVPIISIQFCIRAKTPFDIFGPMNPAIQDSIAAVGNLWESHSKEITKILEKDTQHMVEQFFECIECMEKTI